VFDFAFGDLAPGASRVFNIFYGSRESEASALSAIAALGANVYSLGQNSDFGGADPGVPATFLFAFGGVGGVEPGMDPNVPILPFVPAPGTFVFDAPTPRRWYDPPLASGFTYELTGGATFTEVAVPPPSFGFGPIDVEVGGSVVGTVAPGGSFDLTPFLTSVFSLTGISPLVDAGDPTAFPTFLDWAGTATSLTMTAIAAAPPVPEPAAMFLLALGAGAAARRYRRGRAA
jgi:hypothetical protein